MNSWLTAELTKNVNEITHKYIKKIERALKNNEYSKVQKLTLKEEAKLLELIQQVKLQYDLIYQRMQKSKEGFFEDPLTSELPDPASFGDIDDKPGDHLNNLVSYQLEYCIEESEQKLCIPKIDETN